MWRVHLYGCEERGDSVSVWILLRVSCVRARVKEHVEPSGMHCVA